MHLSPRLFVPAVAGVMAVFSFPALARADWQPFNPGTPYCADAKDFSGAPYAHEQHMAAGGGQIFAASCGTTSAADPIDNDWLMEFNVGTGAPTNMNGGAAAFVSGTSAGHVWAVAESTNYDVSIGQNPSHIFLWNGRWWTQMAEVPGGRRVHDIAATSDGYAYVLADAVGSDSCPGGRCIWSGNGSSWQPFTTYANGTQGATALAYDASTGKPWIVTDDGHVRSWAIYYFYGSYYETYFQDMGAPPYGAVSITVLNGVPWVINGAGAVYALTGGSWTQQGTRTNATDIASDPTTGLIYIIANTGSSQSNADNIMTWNVSPPVR